MPYVRTDSARKLHPALPQLRDEARKGAIARREFLRMAALLGVALPSARALIGEAAADEAPAAATSARAEATPRQGGILRFASEVREIGDPALAPSIEASDMLRNALERLVELDADNVARPRLAESWQPNEDLTQWRFKLRAGVKWSNGEAFTAEDVEANIARWTPPKSPSAMRIGIGRFAGFEKHGPLEFTLHLASPMLGVPEALSLSSAAILHRRFDEEGGDWSKNPIGTGPFALAAYEEGRRCGFRRRDDYWGGRVHLDGVDYLNVGTKDQAQIAALARGDVDTVNRVGVSDLDALSQLPSVELLRARAANTFCMRMKPAERPFDDLRVRKAIVLAADSQRMLDGAVSGNGLLAENHHVAPFHPEYAELPRLRRNVGHAKALLVQAEYGSGVDIELTLGNTQGDFERTAAALLQKSLAEAGIRLRLNVVPRAKFWATWMKVPFGMTYWAHRPLGVTALDLAYRSSAPWNETGFSDPEFDKALDQAMAIADPRQRAAPIATCEKILQDACVMVQPFWLDEMTAAAKRIRGLRAHPTDYYDLREVWISGD